MDECKRQRGIKASQQKLNSLVPWGACGTDHEALKLIASMTVDCMMGRGTDTPLTYAKNLRMYADIIDPTGGAH